MGGIKELMNKYMEKRNEKGFTLIELLIAIVVVGILAAVAIVGIGGLTTTGGKSACTQSADSAKAASAAFYANNLQDAARSATPWPNSIKEMGTAKASDPTNTPAVFELPTNAKFPVDDSHMVVGSWTLAMANGGGTQPTFTCP
jgi:prepilin-type N-terminal cleavage/methylation domain-containing protein